MQRERLVDEQGVKDRVSARTAANAAASLVLEEADSLPTDVRSVFLDEFHRLVSGPPVELIPVMCKPPMTDEEAKPFGIRTTMPYGEFKDRRVDDVPLDRLLWYADQRFTDELRRYLKSPRIQAEIDAMGDC